ncbi:hypothetical protein N7449_003143 [Penicillium cf. viridicatum]|uniref:Transcription factor domain-containing protein n=1 Tax=Penicillium cf. viridicatum TaxID=2972119 RepID=A0A9W9MWQ0_9EURO|nr:hypothetical protein N7449_003143 [Penicillium cf. viridicatum]
MLKGQDISDKNQSVHLFYPFGTTNTKTVTNGRRPTITELSARMYQLERLVHSKLHTSVPNWGGYERSESEANHEPAPLQDMSWEETCVTATPRHERLAHVQPTTFSGETSIRYTLNQLEGDLARSGEKHEPSIADTLSRFSTPTLTPSPSPGGRVASCMAPDIHKVLQSLWRQYIELWDTWFSETLNPGLLGGRDEQITVAQLFMCLAIGRCTASPRVASAEARHSAGWSLYGAATDLFGDILSSFEECSNQVLVLQTLALMV